MAAQWVRMTSTMKGTLSQESPGENYQDYNDYIDYNNYNYYHYYNDYYDYDDYNEVDYEGDAEPRVTRWKWPGL